MIGLREGEDPCELERLVRMARGRAAVARIRWQALSAGADSITPEVIEAELRAAREARSRHADRP